MSILWAGFRRIISLGVDLILPPRCPVSGDVVDHPGALSPESWAGLHFISAPICSCCGFPFGVALDVAGAGSLCAGCMAFPRPYTMARSALVYDDASRDLILAFKHGDQTQLTVTFTPWLLSAGQDMLEGADALVPVPLHPLRLLKRR